MPADWATIIGDWGWLAAGLGAFALLAWLVVAVRRRAALVEIVRAIESLDLRRPVRPVQPRIGGITGRLARAVNEVAPRLEAHLEQLEGDRQQLRAVLGGMAESVIAVDGRRRLVFANEAAVRLFNLAPGSVGRLVAEIIRSPELQHAVDSTLSSARNFRGEIITQGPESWPRGSGRCLAVHGTALPGTPSAGAVLVLHDVTDLRRLERMRQDFVANASHEFKTPLAAIKAYAETLLDWAIHDDQVNVRFLNQIDEQTDRLHRLVQDMLSLARLEAGQDSVEPGPFVVEPLLRQSIESYRDRAEASGLEFHVRLEFGQPDIEIHGDQEGLRQIVENLLDNAIKYTPAGGRIQVQCKATADRVRLSVADSGIGIPREDLPRIFERFYRVDQARSRQLGGTGLGLSIVKHAAQSLGGQITVDSSMGAGSVFTVSIPTARSAAGPRPHVRASG
jgi:two-component system phosphate regulon sensor histidine kinase PhoR